MSRGARCDLVTITNHDAALERVARYVAYVREDARGAGCRSEPTNGPETRAQICEVTVPLNRNNTSFGRLHKNWDCARAWKTEARARPLALLETHVRGGRHGTSSRWCVPFACSLCAKRVDVADAGDASRASPGRRVVGARNQPGFQARAYVLGLDGTETWRAGARRRAASIVTRAMASRRVVSARSSASPRLDGRTARRSSPSLPSIRGFFRVWSAPPHRTHTLTFAPQTARSTHQQPSQKTFKIKQKLGKKQKQNRPLPQWVRMRTGNTIRYAPIFKIPPHLRASLGKKLLVFHLGFPPITR